MSLQECISSLDAVSQKISVAFQSVQDKEKALEEREKAIEKKILEIQEQEDEISSYKKVSVYNKLCKQVDELKCRNELLIRSNDALKRYLKERGGTRGDTGKVSKTDDAKKQSPIPDKSQDHSNNEPDEPNDEDEDDEELVEELNEITFKGEQYNTDSKFLYDIDSGDAVAYKYKTSFRFYKKKEKTGT